jgi:putative restriction endonuclease
VIDCHWDAFPRFADGADMVPLLEHYFRLFAKLNRSPARTWDAGTRGRAPHKPLLLLAILDLVDQGRLSENRVELSPDLLDEFYSYWQCLEGQREPGKLYLPMFHLRSEGFWRLEPQEGQEVRLAHTQSMESFRKFHLLIRAAHFDEDLFILIANPASRQRLREVLISSYFDAATGSRLAQRAIENRQAFGYSEYLLQRCPTPTVEEPPLPAARGEYVRDQAFRRAVMVAYDRRCGLCGIKIVTLDGATAVDAAHIKAWRESHDDRPANGVALCRLCHWAFDAGMLGIRRDFEVLTDNVECAFRPLRSPIPVEPDHSFRSKPSARYQACAGVESVLCSVLF